MKTHQRGRTDGHPPERKSELKINCMPISPTNSERHLPSFKVWLNKSNQKLPAGSSILQNAIFLIKSNTNKLLNLVNTILDLAKIESGKMGMKYIHGDIIPFLRYTIQSLESFCRFKEDLFTILTELIISRWTMIGINCNRLFPIWFPMPSNLLLLVENILCRQADWFLSCIPDLFGSKR